MGSRLWAYLFEMRRGAVLTEMFIGMSPLVHEMPLAVPNHKRPNESSVMERIVLLSNPFSELITSMTMGALRTKVDPRKTADKRRMILRDMTASC